MNSEAGYHEFWKAAHEHYPEKMKKGGLLDQGVFDLVQGVVNSKPQARFVKPTDREWVCDFKCWDFPNLRNFRAGAMALTYKGLINIKSPFDLALYTRLIWELQPKTIIELGSFQGGSGLWFADQMTVLCEAPGEVHSFDVHTKCLSQSAKHPRLHFHWVDLRDTDSFDSELLKRLPHPWIVVDDAHIRVLEVFRFLNRFLALGDYYIVEDVPLPATVQISRNKAKVAWTMLRRRLNSRLVRIMARASVFEDAGLLVDTQYTDAYGLNVTCAPNSWFRKARTDSGVEVP
jgi:hypothetical protein